MCMGDLGGGGGGGAGGRGLGGSASFEVIGTWCLPLARPVHTCQTRKHKRKQPLHTAKFVEEAQENGTFIIPCVCFTRVNRGYDFWCLQLNTYRGVAPGSRICHILRKNAAVLFHPPQSPLLVPALCALPTCLLLCDAFLFPLVSEMKMVDKFTRRSRPGHNRQRRAGARRPVWLFLPSLSVNNMQEYCSILTQFMCTDMDYTATCNCNCNTFWLEGEAFSVADNASISLPAVKSSFNSHFSIVPRICRGSRRHRSSIPTNDERSLHRQRLDWTALGKHRPKCAIRLASDQTRASANASAARLPHLEHEPLHQNQEYPEKLSKMWSYVMLTAILLRCHGCSAEKSWGPGFWPSWFTKAYMKYLRQRRPWRNCARAINLASKKTFWAKAGTLKTQWRKFTDTNDYSRYLFIRDPDSLSRYLWCDVVISMHGV